MSDNMDKIKEELDEIRKIRADLQEELEELRREKETLRATERLKRPIRPPHPPRVGRTARIDFDPLVESLDGMMEDLGEQIRLSLSGIEDIGSEIGAKFAEPFVKDLRITPRSARRRSKHDKEVEAISPERVARIVSPLGSEERLSILAFLREGAKTFNELESHTGKTGSSLTHHLSPLLEAGYVIKGEVRGTYYVTVEGRLAYRLAQWLTSQVERERSKSGENGESRIVRVLKEEEDSESEVEIDDNSNEFGIDVDQGDSLDEEDDW